MSEPILTLANQLTLLRLLLIPGFVLFVVYGRFGWALVTFAVAGLTDALDGLVARRANQRTSLGAWLDPAADKLLLVTTFIVLTLPNLGLPNRVPVWLTVLVISRDIAIVLTVAIVNLAVGPAHVPAVAARQGRDRALHRDLRGGALLQLSWRDLAGRRRLRLGVPGHHAGLVGRLRVADVADCEQLGTGTRD